MTTAVGMGKASRADRGTGPGRMPPALQQALTAPPGEMLTVIVTLREQADLDATSARDVVEDLQRRAAASQGRVRAFLEARRHEGRVGRVIPFWIFNGLAVTADTGVIGELAAHPDVLRVTPDRTIPGPAPVQDRAAAAPSEPNLTVVHAPTLWALGFRGEGVVVATLDTGVSLYHPELAVRWRGGANSWFDPYGQHATPADLNGHGTYVMGVIVGGDAGGSAIGIAPQAQWIAAKIFDDGNQATVVAIHQAFQWLLDPDNDPATPDAPQVVNNSWGFGAPGCDLEFQLDLQVLRAVGILPVFAAGNFGSGIATSVSPANYPEAFAVGAVDNAGQMYAQSSRGPSACGEPETVYPELVAPGIDVLTTHPAGIYVRETGTSMAAPHVAGALALLLNAYPDLTVAEQEETLIHTASDLGAVGPDNDFGHGHLDVLAAYHWVTANRLPQRVYLPLACRACTSPVP
jgi:subtilisin family serine protease